MEPELTESAKLLLLASLLARDRVISNNGKAFLKELIIRKDPRVIDLLGSFETRGADDLQVLEQISDVITEETECLFSDLFSYLTLEDAKTISKTEREEKELSDDKSLIYGEVDFNSFVKVLQKLGLPPGGLFYDLGSGSGRAVFAARFTQDFKKCVGIEVLEGLATASQAVVEKHEKWFRQYLDMTQPQEVEMIQGSILDYDWSDGDVCFANSTCFDDRLMQDLSAKAESLRPGAYFVTFTKPLTSTRFEVLEKKRYSMSWGPATVFVHRRMEYEDEGTDEVAAPQSQSTFSDRPKSARPTHLKLRTNITSEEDFAGASSPQGAALQMQKQRRGAPQNNIPSEDDLTGGATSSPRDAALWNRKQQFISTSDGITQEGVSSPYGSALRKQKIQGDQERRPAWESTRAWGGEMDTTSPQEQAGAPSSPYGAALRKQKGARSKRNPQELDLTVHGHGLSPQPQPQEVSSPYGTALRKQKQAAGRRWGPQHGSLL
jgi:SAM-dependent methyltransferase